MRQIMREINPDNKKVMEQTTKAAFLLEDTNRHRLTHSSTVCHS